MKPKHVIKNEEQISYLKNGPKTKLNNVTQTDRVMRKSNQFKKYKEN